LRPGELERDFVVVLRFQGPRANGMPELHKLTPILGLQQDKGFRVAMVTDGRMSGASGKIPAAIHLHPEAYPARDCDRRGERRVYLRGYAVVDVVSNPPGIENSAASNMASDLTLVGDVGGTNCRLALAERTASGHIELHHSQRYPVAEYEHFNDVVASYLETHNVSPNVGSFAFAGPKFDDEIRMTNLNWIVSEAELRKRLANLCALFQRRAGIRLLLQGTS